MGIDFINGGAGRGDRGEVRGVEVVEEREGEAG